GGRDIRKISRQHPLMERTGWCRPGETISLPTTPSALTRSHRASAEAGEARSLNPFAIFATHPLLAFPRYPEHTNTTFIELSRNERIEKSLTRADCGFGSACRRSGRLASGPGAQRFNRDAERSEAVGDAEWELLRLELQRTQSNQRQQREESHRGMDVSDRHP